jgi:glycosyltransferase involved in cell wall biosynthesis
MRAAAMHFTSEMEKEECARFGLPCSAFVVPNSIDLSGWWRDEEAGRRWRGEIGAEKAARVFLYAGRIHHKKGLDLLPEAAAAIRDLEFRIVFLGRDEDGTVANLDSAFRAAGIRDRVDFLPMTGTEGLRAAYSGSDCLLLPSRHENFGNVAVESLACGCPVVLSDTTGVAGEIHGRPGVTVLPRRAGEWTEVMAAGPVVDRDALRSVVEDTFSATGVAARMAAEYETLR